MKKNRTYNWKSLEESIRAELSKEQDNKVLNNTPFYPLAFHTRMPKDVDFDNGHLSFRFKDFKLNGLLDLNVISQSSYRKENKIQVSMRLNEIALEAMYQINSKYASMVNIDTAGNMTEFGEGYSRVAGASDGDTNPLSPAEIDAMVTQARDQKTPINATANGPELMSSYQKHSESYNSAFVVSENLRQLWAAQGVTTEMSRDTHEAVSNDTTINSDSKVYANGLKYNPNAGTQQTNVSTALLVMALKAKGEGNTKLYEKYKAASKASATFQNNVNPNNNAPTSNKTDVYNRLNDKSLKMKEMSDEEFDNMFDQANDEDGQDGGADEKALSNGWRILKGDERKLIRERMFLFEEEMTMIKNSKPELLWAGDCWATLNGTEASVTLNYDESNSEWEVSDSKVSLPGFAIELDDSFWTGKTADIVRERMASIHFVKSLLQSKIKSSLENMMGKVVLRSFTAA